MADFSLNVKINGVEQAVTTVNELEAALRATREELKNTQIGSQAFEQLSTQAQTLQREFVNSYKETTNFQKGIAELGQSVGSLASTVTAGFTIATSAFQLFGSESEELSEAQVKAQQALALALSATTIATNAKTLAEDLGNVASALGLNLSIKNTVATAAQATATTAQATATTGAAVAQEGLNVAMASNPIGLVLVALTALIGALVVFSGNEEEAKINIDETNKALREQAEINRKAADDYEKLIKAKRDVDLINAKSEEERVKIRKDTEDELARVSEEARKFQESKITQANNASIEAFKTYAKAYTGTVQETYYQPQYDEFGVYIGELQATRDVEVSIGQSTLDSLKTQRDEAIKKEQEFFNKKKVAGKLSEQDEQLQNIRLEQIQTQYYIDVLQKQQQFIKQSDKADDENAVENLNKVLSDLQQTRAAYEDFYKQRLADQIEADKKAQEEEAKKQKEREEAYKKYLQDRKDAQKEYNKEIFDLNQELEVNDEKRAKQAAQRAFDDAEKAAKEDLKKRLITQTQFNELRTKLQRKLNEDLQAIDTEFRIKTLNASAEAEEAFFVATQASRDKLSKTASQGVFITADELEKQLNENQVVYQSKLAVFEQLIKDSQSQITKFEEERRGKTLEADDLELKQRLEASKKLAIAQRDTYVNEYEQKRFDILKSFREKERQIEIAKLEAQLIDLEGYTQEEKEQLDTRFNNLKNSKDKDVVLEQQSADLRLKVLEIQKQQELDNLDLSESERIAIVKKYAQEELKIKQGVIDAVDQKQKEQYQALVNILGKFATDANSAYGSIAASLAQGTADFVTALNTDFETTGEKINAYAQAIGQALLGVVAGLQQAFQEFYANQLNELDININSQKDARTQQYNDELAALKARYDAGLETEQSFRDAQTALNDAYSQSMKGIDQKRLEEENKIKKKAFAADKALKITQAVIAGAQGAVQAFASAMVIPPPAGPIIGGVLAGVIAALTAAQVAIISKQQFNPGQQVSQSSVSLPSTGGGDVGGNATQQVTQASTGGFTGFSPNLTGPNVGAQTGQTGTTTTDQNMRVYVVESDITDSQNRVRTLESNATFG